MRMSTRAGMKDGMTLAGLATHDLYDLSVGIKHMSKSQIIERIREIREKFNKLCKKNPGELRIQPETIDYFLEEIIRDNRLDIKLEELEPTSWICKGCGIRTNKNPCDLVHHRKEVVVQEEDGPKKVLRDVFCNTPKTE
jgi:hypothetical protein